MEPWWIPPLRDVVGGRDVVIAGAVPAAWVDHVVQLRAAGARSVLVAATDGHGAGDGPDVPTVVVEPPAGSSMMERLRHAQRSLDDPPPELVAALDEFDPAGTALVVGSFLNTSPDLAGRPFVGHRRPEWLALEDKTVVDAFWDRAGVARLPSTVVALDDASATAPGLDRGAGTVWAADARDGFHGGATHTHWVPDDGAAGGVEARLRPVCDRVRIMPFVDGVACSIHGIVLPDGVAVLRPVEMVTLRRGHELVYAGCATFWDPDPEIRVSMIEAARRCGRRLAEEVGFRGTFTIDGVVDGDGFWPSELNPRFGVGIRVATAATGVPMMLLNDFVVGGRPIGRTAAELEADLVAGADEHRGGGTWRVFAAGDVAIDAPIERDVTLTADGWRWCEPGDDGAPDDVPDVTPDEVAADGRGAAGTVVGGNGFLRCAFRGLPVGPSVAPAAVAFWAFADEELGTGMGPLTAPPDHRR